MNRDTDYHNRLEQEVTQLKQENERLKQENAKLRKDKERLDWLQSSGLTLHSWEEGDVWAEAGIYTLRVYIDKQMEEAQ